MTDPARKEARAMLVVVALLTSGMLRCERGRLACLLGRARLAHARAGVA